MALMIQPVQTAGDMELFAGFPWQVNRADPCWVPPSLDDRLARLDPQRNPFWHTAERCLWLARQDGRAVGTIAAILDSRRVAALGQPVGTFGFFDCLPDREAAQALFATAEDWLRARGMRSIRGPYNPAVDDESGILIDGFQTRPAILEAHNPAYYAELLAGCGYGKYLDLVARLWQRQTESSLEQQMPGKLLRAAARAGERADLRIRLLDRRRWDAEIDTAWQITCEALCSLPDYVPIQREEFHRLAGSFRPVMDPRMALVAEIAGQPVGFVLALPDINEALQRVSRRDAPRRLGMLSLLRLLWLSRRCARASFKLLMIRPAFQGRGAEAVLAAALARAIWERGYREVDMSLTGEENEKSNRFQENLGFAVYRRYRIFQKEL